MKIEKFEVIDKTLFWPEKKILIIGDLHLGYENYLNEHGWTFPKTQLNRTISNLNQILQKIVKKHGKLNEIILLGDVKHFFAGILRDEFKDVDKIIALLDKNLKKGKKIIITKGNHDTILLPIIKKYTNIELKDSYILKDTLFFHGNREGFKKIGLSLYDKKIKIIVMAHYHPAISLSEDVKTEKYKCFLYGKAKEFGNRKLILIPSFFPLIEGSDILTENLMLKENLDISDFKVFALDGSEFSKVYDFGKAKNLVCE